MHEDKPSLSRGRIIGLILVMLVMAWVGYQMRGIEEGERQMDEAAERYFERLDSVHSE
jgi:hypothetical protein